MPHSLSQPAALSCPACGRSFTADMWLVVDASERPDLLDRIQAGTLHDLLCPHCGYLWQADAPLLLYRPGDMPPLIFSPAQGTTKEQAQGLLGYLHDVLGSAWHDEWLEVMPAIPREFLPAALSDDPEAAMRQMTAQTEQALARLREEDPDAYRELEAAARQMAEQNSPAEQAAEQGQFPPGLDPARAQALANELVAWMRQETLAGAEAYLEARKATLLTDEGAFVMTLLVQSNPGNPTVSDHQRRLARAREVGVPALYAEIRQQRVQEAQAAEESLPPAVSKVLAELAQSDVAINSQDDLERALAARPDLQARLAAALGGGPVAPPQFEADLQQAQIGKQRYVQRGDRRGLDEAAAAWERILQHPAFPQTDNWFQLAALNNSGGVFLRRYWAQGQLADLTRALELWQTAVQRTPPDSPDLSSLLINLGNGLHNRYARTGQLADLEEAIRVYQTAVQRTPPDSPELPMYLNNLGSGLRDRYARTGQLADLEKAIRASQTAVQRTPSDSLELPRNLNNLGLGLRDRYARTGQLADLAEAIRASQTAVQHTPPDSPELPMYLNNLGSGLSDRYAHTGQLADLEEAIRVYQTAVQRTPPDSPELPRNLNNLGDGLRDRYARTGRLADLEEAIRASQSAVQRTPPDSPDLPSRLNNLGNGLRDRYARTGQLADLEETIRVYQTAVQRTPPDSPDLPSLLNNLGGGLRARYARTGQLADLEEAIRASQTAVQRTTPDSPDLPRNLNNLGNGLRDRYARTGQLADLEEAIRVYQTAVQRTPPDSPDLPSLLTSLGNGLRDRCDRTGQLTDLEEAIRVYQTAVQRTPPDSPGLPRNLNNLGNGLRDRYARTGQLADLEEAMRIYEQACLLGRERQPEAVIVAARSWGQWALARQTWDEAVRAYQYGLAALEQLYQTQLLQHEQQSWQREGQGLYARTAYALARVGDLFAAAIALEQGQARGLNDRLARDEANLLQVQQQAPALFQQYQASAARLRQLEAAERQERLTSPGAATPPDWATQSGWVIHRQQVQQARTDLQTAIAAIRRLDGYEHFLLPPRFEEVATAVQPGHPLAYVVTTPAGSLALLLHRPAPTAEVLIEPLWADAFTTDNLDAFLFKEENGREVGYLSGQFSGGTILRRALADGLPHLGAKLLSPLAHRLHALGLQRVTLIPGGRLNLLPLHAATLAHNGDQPTSPLTNQPPTFGETFTISYAPSARTLTASRRRLENQADQSATLLVVGNPLPLPGEMNVRPLRYARPEAEEIALRFGGTPHLYCETAATHAAITAAIPGTSYLHFSCHGTFDPEQPLQSGLILSGGERLTLRQVLDNLPLTAARLVTLSACQTAISDFGDLPDEVIGLPAGFLQAGAVGVLGSLWPVDDLSTALFMDHFYLLHRGNGTDGLEPAAALQATQRWLRCLTVAELSDLFADYRAAAPDVPTGRMAYALAQEKYVNFTLAENQDMTPYADPYYWAAFAFYGM